MTQTKIQFVSKNGALFDPPTFINSQHIPRVGELIDTHDLGQFSHNTFIVVSVVYNLTEEGFIPLITAKEWFKGLRHELLEARGWLPGKNSDLFEYDEDDPSLYEPRKT